MDGEDPAEVLTKLAEAGKGWQASADDVAHEDVTRPTYIPTQQDIDTLKASASSSSDMTALWESLTAQEVAIRDVGR